MLIDDAAPGWSPWLPFPDPRVGGILRAPFGPGVYELRLAQPDGSPVLVGIGANLSARMASLLPRPLRCGTRNATDKRDFVLANLLQLEYRTLACVTKEDAVGVEQGMLRGGGYRLNR